MKKKSGKKATPFPPRIQKMDAEKTGKKPKTMQSGKRKGKGGY